MKQLVLASTSKYRKNLLQRLQIQFATCVPDVDETPLSDESAAALVQRLALAKAQVKSFSWADALIIGSDQIAVVNNQLLGKPNNIGSAYRQLECCSNQAVEFHTGLCLLDTSTDQYQFEDVVTTVYFRNLNKAEIRRYIDLEKPFECAGSFRSEALGITLFERILSEDPTALLGLPLIALCRMLREAGQDIP